MALFGLLGRRGNREVTVYVGDGMREAVLGMPVEEVYRTQPELQAVVSFLASNVAQLPLKCYVRESDDDRPRDTEGPLPTLLADPGGGVTPFELMLGTASDLYLYGWALWWVIPSADAAAGFELRRISPSWVTSAKTVDGFSPSRYVVKNPDTDGHPVPIDAGSCVRFQTYNPGHPTVPLSPVESLKQVLAERASSRAYRNKVWQNGGWFSRHIERPASEGEWGKEARERFARSMKAHFSGPDGVDSGGIPIFEDGMRLVSSTLNAKEAEWAESMRLTREDVAAAYHVNPASVWSNDGQTYASVRENSRSLYADTLGPTLRLIQDRIRLTLVPMIGADPRCYAEFDLSAKLAGSFEEQATVLSQSVGGPWMTRNEARARQNLPALEGADELIVPMNVTEGGLASPHDTDPTQGYYSAPAGARGHEPCGCGACGTHGHEGAKGAPDGPSVARGAVRIKANPSEATVSNLEELLESFYGRQATSIANQLASMDPADIETTGSMGWWNKDRWVRELEHDLTEALRVPSSDAARAAMRALGVDPDTLDGGEVDEIIGNLCHFRADDIVQSTLTGLAKDLDALEELTPDSIRACVGDHYGRLMDSRVGRNARSIASASTNASTVEGAKQSGTKCMKEWVATGHKTRPSHLRMSGQRVPIDAKFSNGARWPGDTSLPPEESCNCACHIEIVKDGRDSYDLSNITARSTGYEGTEVQGYEEGAVFDRDGNIIGRTFEGTRNSVRIYKPEGYDWEDLRIAHTHPSGCTFSTRYIDDEGRVSGDVFTFCDSGVISTDVITDEYVYTLERTPSFNADKFLEKAIEAEAEYSDQATGEFMDAFYAEHGHPPLDEEEIATGREYVEQRVSSLLDVWYDKNQQEYGYIYGKTSRI